MNLIARVLNTFRFWIKGNLTLHDTWHLALKLLSILTSTIILIIFLKAQKRLCHVKYVCDEH